MASMNYCFTVCRATDEKVQQEIHPNPSNDPPNSLSPGNGAYIFGRFFTFGSSPSSSSSSTSSTQPTHTHAHPFVVKASSFTDIDEDLF